MKSKTGGQSIAVGAAILLASNFIVKIIGAVFQIVMFNTIGSDVMGFYAAAFKVYAFFFIITTTGLPIALSRMVASANALGRIRALRRVLRTAMYFFAALGLIGTLIMFVFAHGISGMIEMPGSEPAIRVIAPSVFLICIVSGLRGYYQGMRNMTPTAVSQIIEVLFKLFLGFGAGFFAKNSGEEPGVIAAYVVSGITVGVLFSAVYMVATYAKSNPIKSIAIGSLGRRESKVLQRLIAIGLPITLTAVIINLTGIIDLVVINRALSAQMPEDAVNLHYSWYVNISETLSSMPSSIIVGIGISILPAVTYWVVRNKLGKARKSVRAAVRITSVLALPCAVGLAVLSRPIIMLLFRNYAQTAQYFDGHEVSAIDVSAPSLIFLSVAIVATCLYTTTTSAMQSCGLQNKTIVSAAAATSVKLIVTIVLMLIPGVGVIGAAIGTSLCYIVAVVSNARYLKAFFGRPIGVIQVSILPLFASLICGLSAWLTYKVVYSTLQSNILAVFIAIAVAALVYAMAILFTKAIPPSEIKMLPKGNKIYALLEKLKLY